MYVGGVRRHSSGKQKVMKLERELARLQATSLEQLQEQVKQQVLYRHCRLSYQRGSCTEYRSIQTARFVHCRQQLKRLQHQLLRKTFTI